MASDALKSLNCTGCTQTEHCDWAKFCTGCGAKLPPETPLSPSGSLSPTGSSVSLQSDDEAEASHCCPTCQIDIDLYHENAYRHLFEVGDITVVGNWQRAKDAAKVWVYHVPAFIVNAVRFVVYTVFSFTPLALIGVLYGAMQKKLDPVTLNKTNTRDYFLVYRRTWKNLKFMVNNLTQLAKHTLAAIPGVSYMGIEFYKGFTDARKNAQSNNKEKQD